MQPTGSALGIMQTGRAHACILDVEHTIAGCGKTVGDLLMHLPQIIPINTRNENDVAPADHKVAKDYGLTTQSSEVLTAARFLSDSFGLISSAAAHIRATARQMSATTSVVMSDQMGRQSTRAASQSVLTKLVAVVTCCR